MTSPWHWQPEAPVEHNPIFSYPIKFVRILRWYRDGWKPNSENGIFMLMTLLAYFFMQPSMAVIGTSAISVQT